MCGIAGYIGPLAPEPGAIERTLALMVNRGPDHQGFTVLADGDVTVTLLAARLSILDLDERSNQPFRDGHCTLVFNGEIYNYLELRDELERHGRRFRTESDTEVLLEAYRHWGPACVEHFEGMWAFALYDRRAHTLLLSRDRFAEKPLFYMERNDGLYFGSEVKYLPALSGRPLEVNVTHLLRLLVNGYKALGKTAETFHTGVREVPYATNLAVRADGSRRADRYWSPRPAVRSMSLDDAVAGLNHWLDQSMRLRLRADVPVAFCLSGGVDSGALASIAARRLGHDVAAFSISDADERYNELANIRATVTDLGCRHELLEVPADGALERLQRLIAYHDAPLLGISPYLHSFLTELIAQRGYRVTVSGTAADELLTGYYDHYNLHLYELREHRDFDRRLAEWQSGPGRFVRNPHLRNPRLYFDDPAFREHVYLNHDVFAGFLDVEFDEPFVEQHYCPSLLRNRMLNELFHEATPGILHEEDRNSMLFSLENRSPYLDARLFDFACSIPPELLIRDGLSKYVLREAVRDVLNPQVRLDPHKRGFNASIHSLLDFARPETRAFVLDRDGIYDLVDRTRIEALLDEPHLANSYSKFLFSVISAKIFLAQAAPVEVAA